MAQTNYTPISLYYSTTASAVPTAANLVPGELAINTNDGKLYYEDSSGVVQTLASKAGALGDVVGPASATDNALARFDATTGKLIQNSVGILSDAGALTGITDFTYTGTLTGGTGIVNLGSGQFYKDASGFVGLGTTTPNGKLVVSNAGANGLEISPTGTNSGTNFTSYNRSGSAWTTLNYYSADHRFYSTGAEAMRIDSSGNLGIGTSSPSQKLDVVGNIISSQSITIGSGGLYQAGSIYADASWGMIFRSKTASGGGQGAEFMFASSTGTERMRIDSSGNVGIGTSSPANFGAGYASLAVNGSTGGVIDTFFNGTRYGTFYAISGIVETGSVANVPYAIRTNNTERMRIDSDGNLLVGGSTRNGTGRVEIKATNGTDNGLVIYSTASGGANGTFAQFLYNTSTLVGSITSTGSVTLYNTTSDYRLKTSIIPVADAGQRIDALEPVEYDFNGNGRTKGFLAHQFAEVYPSSVSGEKDAVDAEGNPVYQAMQASSAEVMADLIAEIQSLRQRITTLENK